MATKALLDVVHKEYRVADEASMRAVTRHQFHLAACAALSALALAMARGDLRALAWTRIDVFFLYAAIALVGAAITASIICIVVALWPRDYEQVAPLKAWVDFEKQYRAQLRQDPSVDPEVLEGHVEEVVSDALAKRLAEATDWNEVRNEAKTRWTKFAFYAIVVAIVGIGLQAVTYSTVFLNLGSR